MPCGVCLVLLAQLITFLQISPTLHLTEQSPGNYTGGNISCLRLIGWGGGGGGGDGGGGGEVG